MNNGKKMERNLTCKRKKKRKFKNEKKIKKKIKQEANDEKKRLNLTRMK